MPIGPTRTKAQKQNVVHTEMHKFKEGDLHSGSKQGPVVKNRKQAVAISLSESGQSNKGKKSAPPATGKPPAFGKGESKKNYDRSSHFPGNPGFPGPEGKHEHNQSFAQEQKEHWGSKAEAKPMGKRGAPANVGSEKRGSELTDQCEGAGHTNQPGGNSIGISQSGGAEHHKGSGMGGKAHSFPQSNGAQSFGHAAHVRSGHLRLSGHSGAHQIGRRK